MARKRKTGRRRVRFECTAESGRKVCLAGDFNGWDPQATPLKENDGAGAYRRTLLLSPGRYEYKFVIDGVWCVDPGCPDWSPNDLGSLNSVLEVR